MKSGTGIMKGGGGDRRWELRNERRKTEDERGGVWGMGLFDGGCEVEVCQGGEFPTYFCQVT